MRVSIIIPNYNGERWLGACLDSLLVQTRLPDQVIVADNGSRDRSPELIRSHRLQPLVVALDRNYGFAGAVNRGLESATGDLIGLLNNDAEPDPRWVEAGVRAAQRWPEACQFASLVLRRNDRDRVDSAGDVYPRDGRPRSRGRGRPGSDYAEPGEVFSACAAAAFYSRDLLAELGGLEESFFAYLEDVDLGFRARVRGHRCVFVPEAVVYHQGAGTELGDRKSPRALDSGTRVYWIARNRVRVMARHLPAAYLAGRSPWLLFGLARSAAYHAVVSGQARAFFKGLGDGVKLLSADRGYFREQAAGQKTGFADLIRVMAAEDLPWPP